LKRIPEICNPQRILEYIGGQLVLAGIPAGLILLWAGYKQIAVNPWQRALKFQLWGTYAFFLLSSFKGRTEPNWTIANTIPLAILSYQYLENNNRLTVWLYRLLPVSLLAIAVIRLHYGTDLSKKYLGITSETQHWKAWADTIQQYAGKRPVVFLSSYQKASEYTFYTGNKAFSTSEVELRKSQYNLFTIEEELQNQEVFVCTYWGLRPERTKAAYHIKTEPTEFDGFVVDSFMSWIKVRIEPLTKKVVLKSGQQLALPVKVVSPYKNHPPPNNRSRLTYRIYAEKREKLGDYDTGVLLDSAFATRKP
jgi:hypothetical protein